MDTLLVPSGPSLNLYILGPGPCSPTNWVGAISSSSQNQLSLICLWRFPVIPSKSFLDEQYFKNLQFVSRHYHIINQCNLLLLLIFFGKFLGIFFIVNHVICTLGSFYFFSFLICMPFTSFSCLILLARTSCMLLTKSGENGHLCLSLLNMLVEVFCWCSSLSLIIVFCRLKKS